MNCAALTAKSSMCCAVHWPMLAVCPGIDPAQKKSPPKIPNDEYFPIQWSLENTGQTIWQDISGTAGADIDATEAWDIETGTEDVVIAISDTGIGIPKDKIENIFDPFFSTKEESKSTGLGLFVAYGIIKEHKGTIEVASEEGKGTVFRITLPVNE